jgi:hypothetical protein
MELSSQYDILNVSRRFAAEALLDTAAQQVIRTPVASLRCPSDSGEALNVNGEYRPEDENDARHDVATCNYHGVADNRGPDTRDLEHDARNTMGVLYNDSHIRFADVTDGTSNVLMAGEKCWENTNSRCGNKQRVGAGTVFVCTASNQLDHPNRGGCAALGVAGRGINYESTQGNCNDLWDVKAMFHSLHPGGAQFVVTDGSVHFLGENVNLTTYRRLAHRKDGNPVKLP